MSIRQEEMWNMIVTCLGEAERAAVWAFWRERFNTNHPEMVQREEIGNASQYATANFYAAKALYCDNRDYLDQVYIDRTSGLGPTNDNENKLFDAMRQVVAKEIEQQLERMLTEEETMGRKNYEEPELLDEELDEELELDEDEEYLRKEQGVWDGDEYIGDDEEDDFFDGEE
jgi:hypothetical protein